MARLVLVPTLVARMQGFDGTTWQNVRVKSAEYPNLRVSIWEDDTEVEAITQAADGRAAALRGLCASSFLYGFNGVDWDRLRSSDKNLVTAPGWVWMTVTGTTTDAWADAKDWVDAQKFLHKTLILKNIGAANSLDYQVLVYAYKDGNEYKETSGTLAPGNIVKLILNNWYRQVKFQVKSTTAGAPTDYRLDLGGFKG